MPGTATEVVPRSSGGRFACGEILGSAGIADSWRGGLDRVVAVCGWW